MTHSKPYTADAAAALLKRVVGHVNSPRPRGAAKLLRDLLEAPLGDVVIGAQVVHAIPESPTSLERVFARLGKVLEELLAPSNSVSLQNALTMPRVELTAGLVHGRYVFTVSSGYDAAGQVDVTGFAWLQLLRVVQCAGRDRLRRCECGRVFVRVGKRRFCSERCQTRDYMRRFRAGEAGRG